MMELEALEAHKSGRIRVIVQDNGPIHRCREVQQLWSKWEQMGLSVNQKLLEKNVIIRVPALVNKKANSIGLRAFT